MKSINSINLKFPKFFPPWIVWKFTFLGIIVFTIMSSRRIAYYDFNFLVNTVYRMSQGEIPFKDFDLVLPVVPYFIVFLVHMLSNTSVYLAIYISTCFLIFVSTHSLHGIIAKINNDSDDVRKHRNSIVILIFASLFGVVSSYPNYIYDAVATTFAMASINQFLRFIQTNELRILVLSGFFLSLSIFSKYNMGGFLAIGFIVTLIILFLRDETRNSYQLTQSILVFLLPSVILGGITLLAGPLAVFDQTIVAASKFKNLDSSDHLAPYNHLTLIALLLLIGLGTLRAKTGKLIIVLAPIVILSGLLLVAIDLFIKSEIVTSIRLEFFPSVNFVFPILMLIALHKLLSQWKSLQTNEIFLLISIPLYFFGSFLSQGWNGSNYSLWPLLVLLAWIIFYLNNSFPLQTACTINIGALGLLTLCLFYSNFTGERMTYVEDNGRRDQKDFNFNIIGTAISEQDLDSIREVRNQIELEEYHGSAIVLPAEDSIKDFGLRLTSWGRCLQYTRICPSFNERRFSREFANNPPNIVIIKTKTQIYPGIEPITQQVRELASECFVNKYSNETYELFISTKSSSACLKNSATK